MIGALISPLAGLATTIVDNLFETDEEKSQAQARLVKLEQQGKLQEAENELRAILAEANSPDPWTSRARPTFLYVIYIVIVLCIIGGVIGIWHPVEMQQAALNMGLLLRAVPENLWWLFGMGYLGYTGARSFDKWRSAPNELGKKGVRR